MTDYISREAAIAAVDNYSHVYFPRNKRKLEEIPAADVRPVRRGKWAKELHPNVRYNQYKCSICGEFSGHDSEGWIWAPNFCPHCGADMREES